ncbi:glycerol-3-phosphate dehydrogenase/oxidase [Bacillus salitolerans]|uniref:Glycerol-3-phosphate dehydrogenase n=1 Tax=Bacillus salitolerans TaxID=1437434 RepID=A0ABW4LXQ9_9BACI
MNFSALERQARWNTIRKQKWDVIVIGGGITGAGIALDAASRGMKVTLLEMQDFAAGTSSRSTKLIHGGLRYLKQFQVKLVADVGKEREIVYENGPHVTEPVRMLLPIYKGATYGKLATSFAISVYDFLAGVKKEERKEVLSKKETIKRVPFIKKEGLVGSVRYVEYRTDDARLTIEVMKKANELGAMPINYAKVTKFHYDQDDRIIGVRAIDQLTNEVYDVHGSIIINATGPWSDMVRDFDRKQGDGKYLLRTKGVHVVIDQMKLPLTQAVYYDTPDGRMIFAVPRGNKVYVGTTDTVYEKDLAHPYMDKTDLSYLLKAIDYIFPDVKITKKDIDSSWAGLRPLIHEEGKAPSQLSRKDEIWESASGLMTIAGGKLTGYRKMAEHIVNLAAKRLDQKFDRCRTKALPISGGNVGGSKGFKRFVYTNRLKLQEVGLSEEAADRLVRFYGSNITTIIKEISIYKRSAKTQNLPLDLIIPVLYGIKHEMMVTPCDYFIRRASSLLFDIDSFKEQVDDVISYMKYVLLWTEEEERKYRGELERELDYVTLALR